MDIDLNMSLFDNGITEKSTIYFVHKTQDRLFPQNSLSPVLDYSYNSLSCAITPDLLADLPGGKVFTPTHMLVCCLLLSVLG